MVTKPSMEILSPTSAYYPNSNWILGEQRSGNWNQQENKIFEDALAQIDSRTPNRWEIVAAMIPGKTVNDVINHYNDLEEDVTVIEAGLVPFPGYSSSLYVFDWESGVDGGMKQAYGVGGKRPGGKLSDQDKKKGIPWTEEEHKQFLMGLKKHGKGFWRNISRNFVVTRTPTQVASHAQKYFNRLNSGSKDKRRASIHDITTANLPDNPSQPSALDMQSTTASSPKFVDQSKVGGNVYSSSMNKNRFLQLSYGSTNPFGVKLEAQDSYISILHDSMVGHHNMFI